MGIPRLMLFKQWLTKPIFQSFTNSPTIPYSSFNLIRTVSSSSTPLSPEIVEFVRNSPGSSPIPLLEKYFEEDKSVLEAEIPSIIRHLRKVHLFQPALQVLEWTNRKPVQHKGSSDLPSHLDLIGKVHGVDAAEKFFIEANDHSEKMYNSLLNLYVQGMLVDKALSLFTKMKEMGIASTPLTYDKIMSLYLKNRLPGKLMDLFLEMQEREVPLNHACFKMCLKACALSSDFDSMDKLLKNIKDQQSFTFDWPMYSSVANYYLDGRHPKKAISFLQKAEVLVKDNPIGYANLISIYAKLGDGAQVRRLWQKQKDVCKTQTNHDYTVMLSALVKLDKFEEADLLLEEWKSSGNEYTHKVVDAFLSGYSQKGHVEKAEKIFEEMISKNTEPFPITWGIISEGYVKNGNMQKAVQCMEKALQLGPQHKGWNPKREVISNIMTWLGEHGDSDQVHEFLKLMSQVAPMNKNMYQTLKASKRHGKDINVILQRLKADNVDVDEETSKLMEVSST